MPAGTSALMIVFDCFFFIPFYAFKKLFIKVNLEPHQKQREINNQNNYYRYNDRFNNLLRLCFFNKWRSFFPWQLRKKIKSQSAYNKSRLIESVHQYRYKRINKCTNKLNLILFNKVKRFSFSHSLSQKSP